MMSYEILVSNALPRPLAAVRRTVTQAEIPGLIQGLLGEVWHFLGEQKVKSTGHNVALYRLVSGRGPDMRLDSWFGVEVHETIPLSEHVVATATPAGPVASTVHWGQYSALGEAHAAFHDWCQANGRRLTGTSWEVYGDWSDDWAKVRTDVFYQLEP
jgi:hypothetical protein